MPLRLRISASGAACDRAETETWRTTQQTATAAAACRPREKLGRELRMQAIFTVPSVLLEDGIPSWTKAETEDGGVGGGAFPRGDTA